MPPEARTGTGFTASTIAGKVRPEGSPCADVAACFQTLGDYSVGIGAGRQSRFLDGADLNQYFDVIAMGFPDPRGRSPQKNTMIGGRSSMHASSMPSRATPGMRLTPNDFEVIARIRRISLRSPSVRPTIAADHSAAAGI